MNVTVIYGSTQKNITYDCVHLLLNNLKINSNIKINEFLLAKDYFKHDYSTNPMDRINLHTNASIVDSIIKSLNSSDLVILASPVSACDISVEMKLFLEDLFYHYSINNSTSLMHNKIGLAVSTTAGAGLSRSTNTLEKSLNFIGIHSTFKFSHSLFEIDLNHADLRTKRQISRKLSKLSSKILASYKNLRTVNLPLTNIKTSNATSIRDRNYNVIDLNYWKDHPYFPGRNI